MRGWCLLLLAGCNEFYGLDDTRVADPFEPIECATVRFGPPQVIPDFAGGDAEFDVQLDITGNEIWFVRNLSVYTIHRGWRATSGDPFEITTPDLNVGANNNTIDPSLTADGKRLMFIVYGESDLVLEGVRDDPTSATFDSFRLVSGLGSEFSVSSLDLSWDGLRVYYTIGNELHVADRMTRDSSFTNNTVLFDGVQFPSVSADELEMFYNPPSGRTLIRRARADRSAPWGPEEFLLDEGTDPDIAASSERLLVTRDSNLVVLERECGN